MELIHPTKVQKFYCQCGELMLKVFPWSSLRMDPKTPIGPCYRCQNKNLKSSSKSSSKGSSKSSLKSGVAK